MPLTLTTPQTHTATKSWLDAWHVAPSLNRDYDFIDGLRGLAILMVVVSHHFYINPSSGVLMHYAGAVIGSGADGVILFYALSGFLISWPFWKRKATSAVRAVPQGYAQRRFWKIYPPLALSILLLTPFYILTTSDGSYLSIGAKWLTGLPFIVPISGKFNPVMWTLVVEVQFYITLPLVFLCFKRVSPKTSLVIIAVLFLIIPFLTRALTGQRPTLFPNIDSHYPAALDVFSFGVLVAGLESFGYVKESWVRWAIAGMILWPLACLISAWASQQPAYQSFAMTELVQGALRVSAACLLLFIAQPKHPIARILCVPWLRWCGIISYEWYLFHQPFANWARVRFGPAHGDILNFALLIGIPFVISLIGSATIYRFFSLPLLRYGRQ